MGYNLGKLKNFIYLITDFKYRISGYKVYMVEGKVYKLYADLVTFTELESYSDRFKFTTTVTATLNRVFNDSVLRLNNFKIVVEDYNGQQYIVSPEFDAYYTGEFTINLDTISYVLTFSTLSNIPTRILLSTIKSTNLIEEPKCEYYGLGIMKLFVGNSTWTEVNFSTAEYVKTFNGSYDLILLTFTYPIEDNDWHYLLISFPENRWNIKIKTGNDEITETSLFPQYTRQFTETTGLFQITMTGIAGSNLKGTSSLLPLYRWVPTNEYICDGFTKYVKESKEEFINNEWVSVGEYRKGSLIEANSEDCGYSILTLFRWVTVDITQAYECVDFDKHYQLKQLRSDDSGKTWVDTGVTRAGDIVLVDSPDCGYVLTEWKEVEGEYICEEYDPSVTWVLLSDGFYCSIKSL